MLAYIAALAVAATSPAHHSYATSYCLHGRMANGHYVHPGAAAHDFLWPGTKIKLVGKRTFYGRRRFRVEDTGPALRDGHFDLWSDSCAKSIRWGRRPIRFQLGWK